MIPHRVVFAFAALVAMGSLVGCQKQSQASEVPARMLGLHDQERFRMAVLPSVKGVVSLHVIAGDAEAARFADQFDALLRSCGFSVREKKAVQVKGRVPPLVLIIQNGANPPAHAAALRAGLNAIGHNPTGEVWPDCPLEEVRVMVGPNTPAAP